MSSKMGSTWLHKMISLHHHCFLASDPILLNEVSISPTHQSFLQSLEIISFCLCTLAASRSNSRSISMAQLYFRGIPRLTERVNLRIVVVRSDSILRPRLDIHGILWYYIKNWRRSCLVLKLGNIIWKESYIIRFIMLKVEMERGEDKPKMDHV